MQIRADPGGVYERAYWADWLLWPTGMIPFDSRHSLAHYWFGANGVWGLAMVLTLLLLSVLAWTWRRWRRIPRAPLILLYLFGAIAIVFTITRENDYAAVRTINYAVPFFAMVAAAALTGGTQWVRVRRMTAIAWLALAWSAGLTFSLVHTPFLPRQALYSSEVFEYFNCYDDLRQIGPAVVERLPEGAVLELPVGSINTEVWRAYHLRHLATTANTLNSYLAPVRTEPPVATHRLRFRSSARLPDIFHTGSSPPVWSSRCFEVTTIEQAKLAPVAGFHDREGTSEHPFRWIARNAIVRVSGPVAAGELLVLNLTPRVGGIFSVTVAGAVVTFDSTAEARLTWEIVLPGVDAGASLEIPLAFQEVPEPVAGDPRELAAMVHRVSVQGSRAEAAVVRK
jgi:hypothetical protein